MSPIDLLSDQFDPLAPLEANDTDSALYVDWQATLDPDNVKLLLTNAFARRRATTKWRLLTGHRGVGKTTELYRVQRALKDRNIFTVFLDVDDWLDMDDNEPEDVTLQMMRQIVKDLEAVGITQTGKRFTETAKRWKDAIPREVGFLGFSLARKELPGEDERRQFRNVLRGLLPTTIDLLNEEVLTAAMPKLKALGYHDLVVIVDSLDKIESL